MEIKLSIITPVYNGVKFIESCILNVIEQRCIDAEHLILDACSSDGTVDIIQSYADRYPHIRWISEKDGGQSDAMNKGIAMARGQILGFLNVDDFYEPNVLNKIVDIFKTLPEPALLVGNCNVRDHADHVYLVNKPTKLKLQQLLVGADINPWPVNPSAYFYHKSLHEKVGLYNVDEHYALDVDFLLRAVQVANVTYVNETWGNFRLIKGTKTFTDGETGQSADRVRVLLDKYKRNLPPILRKYFPYYILLQRIEHWLEYRNDPKLFFTVLRNKISRKVRRIKK